MSSLYRRSDEWAPPGAVVRVKTTRLDTFLADKCPRHARLALWIDAEGKAYEVIEGVAAVVKQIQFLIVEVETEPCIGSDQKLYPQVKTLLQRLGFAELATDQPLSQQQFNALFVRRDLSAGKRFQVKVWLVRARLHYLLVAVTGTSCPACLRRYRAMRLKATSRTSGILSTVPAERAVLVQPAPAYRSDIDGLRALAVVAVVLFHAEIPGFSGGFIGVDVFFVISGYLITLLLAAPIDQSRPRWPRDFYVRRARRILPALFVTSLVVSVAAVAAFSCRGISRGLRATLLQHRCSGRISLRGWRGSSYFQSNGACSDHAFLVDRDRGAVLSHLPDYT